MGITISSSRDRVKSAVSTSPEFSAACDAAFAHCLSLTQHAFPGVFPYQLSTASALLHASLSSAVPLIRRWVPSPPSRSQIDSALRLVLNRQATDGPQILGHAEFKQWAAELYAAAVVESAGKAILTRIPIGIAGIAGLGMATRSGKELVGSAIGIYALGVATSIYFGLSG